VRKACSRSRWSCPRLGGRPLLATAIIAVSLPAGCHRSHRDESGLKTAPAAPNCLSPGSDSNLPDQRLQETSFNGNDLLIWLAQGESKLTIHGRVYEPRWENWCTKADVGLDPDHNLIKIRDANADIRSFQGFPLVQTELLDRSRAEIRAQSREKKSELTDAAPVLFNSTAANAIVRAHLAGEQTPDFPVGSLIIKPMWQTVPLSGHIFPSPDYFQIGTMTSEQETTFWGSQFPPSELIIHHVQIAESPFSSCSAWIDRNRSLPEHCLHSHRISKQEAYLMAGSVQASGSIITCEINGCFAVLLGFHVMLMEEEGDAKAWRFTTYWMRSSDAAPPEPIRNLPPPWRYFTWVSTTTERTTSGNDVQNVAFGPYLEGADITRNGAVSNCLNCHKFAYYRNELDEPTRGSFMALGVCLGERPAGGDPNQIPSDQAQYFRDSCVGQPFPASANFVWSIVKKQQAQNNPNGVRCKWIEDALQFCSDITLH
jgi:hypothetical protein